MKKTTLILLSLLLWLTLVAQDNKGRVILIEQGSEWKYFDLPVYPGSDWLKKNFNDEKWASGPAELGYGDGDEKTVINHGKEDHKPPTAYFRKTFEVKDPEVFQTIELNIKRDDGAVVYINGTEIFRTNMPKGKIVFKTPASSALSGGNESIFVSHHFNPKILTKGKNIIAVEVHQDKPTSSDLSFDLSLYANMNTAIIRGPYLQSGTPSSMIVRWRTSLPVKPKVHYGTSLVYTDSIVKNESGKEHIIEISGLKPYTKYYYSVASADEGFIADSTCYFITPPEEYAEIPVRIWSMGDFGSTGPQQLAARDAYYNYSQGTYTNLLLWLGDNAYPKGTDEEYSSNVFSPYKKILSQSVVYSTSGNHDLFHSNVKNESGPYFDIFSFPKNGEAGGVKSGSEAYYSFNYGNIHFVCIESNVDSFGSRLEEMIEWLKKDLSANKSRWTIAYFHYAIYSKGYHDSDINKTMIWMRNNIAPILEDNNVDLVLTGHLHDYERTHLLYGHYGDAASFNKSMIVDKGTGNDPLLYKKNSDKGTMYVIAGCMGEHQPLKHTKPHPAIVKLFPQIFATLVIDINKNKLEGKLLTSEEKIVDYFIIEK